VKRRNINHLKVRLPVIAANNGGAKLSSDHGGSADSLVAEGAGLTFTRLKPQRKQPTSLWRFRLWRTRGERVDFRK